MSKVLALAGLRIGWLACRDATLRHRMATRKDWTTICSSAPSEVLALMGLRAPHHDRRAQSRDLARNLAAARCVLRALAIALDWVRPRGRRIGFPRLIGDVGRRIRAELVARGGSAPASGHQLRACGEPLPARLRPAEPARGARAPRALRERPLLARRAVARREPGRDRRRELVRVELGRVVRGGDADDVHPGRAPRRDACGRVLEDDAVGRRSAELAGGEQVALGIGLAARQALGA